MDTKITDQYIKGYEFHLAVWFSEEEFYNYVQALEDFQQWMENNLCQYNNLQRREYGNKNQYRPW